MEAFLKFSIMCHVCNDFSEKMSILIQRKAIIFRKYSIGDTIISDFIIKYIIIIEEQKKNISRRIFLNRSQNRIF